MNLIKCDCTLVNSSNKAVSLENTSANVNKEDSSHDDGTGAGDSSANNATAADADMSAHSVESETHDDDMDDDDDDEEASWYAYTRQMVQNQLYNLSGFERFKLKTKKAK